MTTIADDLAAASKDGLLQLLRRRQFRNKEVVQPNIVVPPPSAASASYVPPYPTILGLSTLNTFHKGGQIVIPTPLPPQMETRHKSDEDHLASERLVAAEYRKKLAVVLPLIATQELCDKEGLELRHSPKFVTAKSDLDPVKAEMGRGCDDYTASGLNNPFKARILAEVHGPYGDPNEATICRIGQKAKRLFPGQEIKMLKSDYSSYFKRFPITVRQALLLATHLRIDGTDYVMIPLCCPFGLQDSNAIAKTCTEAMHAINADLHIALWNEVLQTTYLDDSIALAPDTELLDILEWILQTSDEVLGPNGTSLKKTFIASVLVVLGFRYDCQAWTIGITMEWLEKLISAIYHELPDHPIPGNLVRLRQLQRTASYMLRTSRIATSMMVWSRGIYANIAGTQDSDYAMVRLSADSVADIMSWRQFLRSAWSDARPLSVSMDIPPLLSCEKGESKHSLWLRQAEAAHEIVNVDACTDRKEQPIDSWGAGWIATSRNCDTNSSTTTTTPPTNSNTITPIHPSPPLPGLIINRTSSILSPQQQERENELLNISSSPSEWGTYCLPRLNATIDGILVDHADTINVYELLAALIALAALISRGRPSSIPNDTKWHIHIWTDNSSALAWCTTNKTTNPLITRLLHIFSDMQMHNNILVTMGHIPGKINILADAASRGFRVTHGNQYFHRLSHLQPHHLLPEWWHEMHQ